MALAGFVLATGCVAQPSDEEDLGEDAAEIASGRCASATASRTVKVKVMTMNLRHDVDEWKRRFELIADEIVRLDPDVIGTQELEIGVDQADALNDRLEARGHARYHVHQNRKSGLRGFFSGEGIAILSRWPFEKKAHEDLGDMRVSVFARIKHPSGGTLDMLDTHLSHQGGAEADAKRGEQIEQTLKLAERNDDCRPTFLTGDLNTGETSDAVKRLVASGFVDSYRRLHASGGNTAMIVLREGAFDQSPKRRIDFVFGRSAGARRVIARESVVCFQNHDAKGFYPSDHLGVMTTYDVRL
jgi:endonuclease/exonuclease/phosphatase family metal-dependent hydrolase